MRSFPLYSYRAFIITCDSLHFEFLKLCFLLQVNPGNAPLVVGQLLDDECPEDFIKGLILSVRSLLPVEPLVEECEKR